MPPLPGGQGFSGAQCADALQRFLEHQASDARQHQNVENIDDRIDLAPALQNLEKPGSDHRAENTADHQDTTHPEVDSLAAHMGCDAGNTGSGDLG